MKKIYNNPTKDLNQIYLFFDRFEIQRKKIKQNKEKFGFYKDEFFILLVLLSLLLCIKLSGFYTFLY